MGDICDAYEMLGLNRTSLYYKTRLSSEWALQLNRLIDITYTKHPEFGYRRKRLEKSKTPEGGHG